MKKSPVLNTIYGLWLLTTLSAYGAPLQRADVIRDPLWVLHFDLDALRQTVVGQYILSEMETVEARQKLAAFQAIFGMDLRRDVHGITVYSATKAEQDGVALVYAEFDPGRLTVLAQGAKGYRATTHREHTIHSWIDEKKRAKASGNPRTYAAIRGRVIVFGQKESRVVEALDVLDGITPNLTANLRFAQLGQGGAVLEGAAARIELSETDPNAAVLKQTQAARLSISENQRVVHVALTLDTESDEVAEHLQTVGRGLIGLMALQRDKPESQKLAQGLRVERTGAAVTANLVLPADDVVAIMKADAARKAAKKAEAQKDKP